MFTVTYYHVRCIECPHGIVYEWERRTPCAVGGKLHFSCAFIVRWSRDVVYNVLFLQNF